jgi:hypothetical protein
MEDPRSWRRADEVLAEPWPQWLVRELVPKRRVVVVYGPPGCGKSFFVEALAMAVARGEPFFGRATKQGVVVYVMLEGAARPRVAAYLKAHGLKPEDIRLCVIERTGLDLQDENQVLEFREKLAAITQNVGPIELVVLDTFARVIGGSENDSETMAAAIRVCEALAQECSVVIVHHTGKDAARGARGHSSLKGAVDTEIEVEELANGERAATVTKSRDGEAGQRFGFRLAVHEVGRDEDGEVVTSCSVEALGHAPKKQKRLGGTERMLVDELARLLKLNGTRTSAPLEELRLAVIERMPRGDSARDKRRENISRAVARLIADRRLVLVPDPFGEERITTAELYYASLPERMRDAQTARAKEDHAERRRRDEEAERWTGEGGGNDRAGG